MAGNIRSVSRLPSSRYRSWCLVITLKCLIVAYIHLFAVIIDIIAHVVVMGIVTEGFQCDVTGRSLSDVDWYILEPVLLAVNIGTHGYYPIPLIITGRESLQSYTMDYDSQPNCYPRMIHVHISDVQNLMINILWLYLVIKFVQAVYKKDTKIMILFNSVCLFKLIIEVLTFSYMPAFITIHTVATIKFIKLLNYAMSGLCLAIIYEYIRVVQAKKDRENETTMEENDEPPTYSDCLISSPPDREDKINPDTVVNQPEATSETRPNLDLEHRGGVELPSYAECFERFPSFNEDTEDTLFDIRLENASETTPIFTI